MRCDYALPARFDTLSNQAYDSRKSAAFPRVKSIDSGAYFTLYIAIGAVCLAMDQQFVFSWIMVLINATMCMAGRAGREAFLSSFLMANEFASIINIIVVVATSMLNKDGKRFVKSKKVTKISYEIIIFGAVLCAVSLLNAAYLGTLANFCIALAYYSFLVFVYFQSKAILEAKGIGHALVLFVFAQTIFALIQMLKGGFHPGDHISGSVADAHAFGLWCCFVAILLASGFKTKSVMVEGLNAKWMGCAVALCLALLYFADCKAAAICGFAGILVWAIVRVVSLGTAKLPLCVGSFIALFMVAVFVLGTPAMQSFLTSQKGFLGEYSSTYLYGATHSIKFRYFEGTLEDMASNGRIIYGYGLGQYGSRFANILGYESTYREESTLNELVAGFMPSNMLDEYAQYASQYNKDIVEWIRWYSAISIYPFSSLLSVIAEGGLIGIAFLLLVLSKMKLSIPAQILAMFFLGCCVMDMYLDHVQLIGFVVVFMAICSFEQEQERSFDPTVYEKRNFR